MRVLIVAGHGKKGERKDDGAVFNGTTERQEVIEIANELTTILERHGVNTGQIGVSERLTLDEKVSRANKVGDSQDILISLHINAATPQARGVEAWYKADDNNGKELASDVLMYLSSESGLTSRGVKKDTDNRHGRLAIVRDVKMTACLVECGFITNEVEAGMLKDPDKDDVFAVGIAKGILANLNIAYKEPASDGFYLDVDKSAWYYDDLKLCVDEKLFVVPPDRLFRPTPERVQLAVVQARHLHIHHGL